MDTYLLGMSNGVTVARRGSSEDELGCLGGGCEGCLVGHTTYLDAKECEKEAEDAGEDYQSGVHLLGKLSADIY